MFCMALNWLEQDSDVSNKLLTVQPEHQKTHGCAALTCMYVYEQLTDHQIFHTFNKLTLHPTRGGNSLKI